MTRFVLAVVLVAAALAAGAADAGVRSGHDGTPATASAQQISEVQDLQAQVLVAINELRREHGLRELQLNGALSRAALGHSFSMAKHGFFSHSGWNGSPFWQRIKPNYRPHPTSYWSVGENMLWASGDMSADQAIEMWLASPEHRKNLLTPAWREVGLGAVRALSAPGVYEGLDVTIITADFGVR
ncbi:MAG TPA: CAP domain-containing protein [Gaiellaceae bacterium]